jgi:hypothetical protein
MLSRKVTKAAENGGAGESVDGGVPGREPVVCSRDRRSGDNPSNTFSFTSCRSRLSSESRTNRLLFRDKTLTTAQASLAHLSDPAAFGCIAHVLCSRLALACSR